MLRWLTSFLVLVCVMSTAAPAQEAVTGEEVSAETRSSVDLLVDVIEDDAARAELIDRLRAAGAAAASDASDDIIETIAADEVPPEDLSFGRRAALVTQQAAENIADWATRTWRQIQRAPAVFDGLSGTEAGVLLDALADLALVIAGTVLAFLVLRWFGKSAYARMSASARDGGAARTVMLFVMSAIIDVLIVILAWAAGYALAILALGEFGTIGIRQTLYLNAFLLVELAKAAVRLVLSPSATSLRPLPISDEAAKYLSARINLIVGVVGYGQLLVVPIINGNVSFAAGRAVSALIAFAVLAFAIWLVLRNRKVVSDWMLGTDEPVIAADPAAEPPTAAMPEALPSA
ncbi:mechanosensitive ion channel protein MscS, partial [Cribrihabitans sp. XS_ASV171]